LFPVFLSIYRNWILVWQKRCEIRH